MTNEARDAVLRIMRERICKPDREPLSTPLLVGEWSVATDGHGLLGIQSRLDDARDAATIFASRPQSVAVLETLLSDDGAATYGHQLSRILSWSGPYEHAKMRKCKHCGGQHKCRSGPLYLEHGRINGILIDRALVSRVLMDIPDEQVSIISPADKEQAVKFVGQGWRAAIMPLRDIGQHADCPSFP